MSGDLVERIRASADRYGHDRRYTFLREGLDGTVENRRTFADLDRRAREIADWLSGQVEPGDRALLLYPDGLDFLEAFLGCLYAKVVAVPAPVSRYRRSMDRLAGILVDAGIPLVLTTADGREDIIGQLGELGLDEQVRTCAATDVPGLGDAERWHAPDLGPDDLAYLQYTSGSTSDPKGVMVSHHNLVHNIDAIGRAWSVADEDVLVGWLPHFHDMGLIAMLLMPLCLGADCVYTAPLSFIKRPLRWARMISEFGGTLTIAPDFAYDLVTRTVTDADLATLDLSSLRLAASGSEPVRPATIDGFCERFAPAGLRAEAVAPSYGLAEATLLVASATLGDTATIRTLSPDALERNEVTPDDTGLRLAGHGRAEGVEVRIVAPESREDLGEGRVGEIWVRGDSVALGYWNRPRVTEEIFRATTSAGDGPFLRTGDLGFVVDGEVFVTGRLKDVIVVQGRNIYPQDVEQVVREAHPALRGRPGVAFSVDAGREHVVIVQEVKPAALRDTEPAELATLIRQAVVVAFDVSYPSVVLVDRPVPRTTSGKVQRRSTRARFLAGELAPIHEDLDPSVPALRTLAVGN